MDRDDLAVLLVGASAEDVDRIHRLLYEWSIGPENSFPVQLALLTRTQWRIAAGIPRTVNDSRKLIEQHLSQYCQETAALVKNLGCVTAKQTDELKQLISAHEKIIQEISDSMRRSAAEAERTADQIQARLETGASHWEQAMNVFDAERVKFEKTCKEMDAQLAWRNLLWLISGLIGMLGIGIGVGHYILR